MSWETQRGILQLISGSCWLVIGLTLVLRSLYRRGFGWPLRWQVLAGIALFATGYTQVIHGMYWLGWTNSDLSGWPLLAPIWIQCIFTALAAIRWFKHPSDSNDDQHNAGGGSSA